MLFKGIGLTTIQSKFKLLACFCIFLPISGLSGELTFEKSVNTSANAYQTTRDNENTNESYALIVQPKLVSIYQSKDTTSAFIIDHTIVEQSGDQNTDRSYTDFQLNSSIDLFENVLKLNMNAAQNYRVSSQSDSFISDRLLSDGDLSKNRKYSTSLDFTIPNPEYIGFDSQMSFSTTIADKSIDNTRLDSTNKIATGRLYSTHSKTLNFQIDAQHYDTERANNRSFTSTIINGNVRLGIFENISFVVLGNDSNYDFDGQLLNLRRQNTDTSSYGAGLRWSPNDSRFIEISYNNLKQEDKETKYIGVNSNWAFSQRTSLGLNYGKRFYGDAYSANFNYNLKHFRTTVTYSEDVTSYSRLSFTTESLGLFVCPIGSSDLVDCFQPEDLNYILAADEEFRSANEVTSDITDEVILNKAGQISFGYTKKKIKVSLNLRVAETEYLESERVQKNKTAILSINYQLGKKSNLGLSSNFSRRNRNTLSLNGNSDTLTTTLSFDRQLSKNAKSDITFRYLDRDGSGIDNSLTDKRITLGFDYTF